MSVVALVFFVFTLGDEIRCSISTPMLPFVVSLRLDFTVLANGVALLPLRVVNDSQVKLAYIYSI
jgi:hypothetical protein